jgi:hypothetical protein
MNLRYKRKSMGMIRAFTIIAGQVAPMVSNAMKIIPMAK